MSMLDKTRKYLEEAGAFSEGQNYYVDKVINSITFPTIPFRMKAVIAVSQITTFASQFRRNIKMWDGITDVPVNAISFVITGSGAGKDSSVKAARKCFSKGYKYTKEKMIARVTSDAIRQAKREGQQNPEDRAVYGQYLKPIPPIDITPTTGEGLVQHINDLDAVGIGAGIMYSGEFSDELAYNQNMIENIKILSEIYDTGDRDVKYTKSVESRSKQISGQPVSGLFVGSPGHILFDAPTMKKFHIAFTSKLARRSWLCYTPEKIEEPTFETMEEMLDNEEVIETKAKQARVGIDQESLAIAKHNLSYINKTINISEEAEKLFKVYKRYNSDLIDESANEESTYNLIRRHLQWKALKLAGAFTLMKKEEEISKESYIEAIRFCELLDNDMIELEKALNKSPHEQLADYMKTKQLVEGSAVINAHELTTKGFMKPVSLSKLKEMVALCAGYDKHSLYSVVDEGTSIQYQPIVKTEVIGITSKILDWTELNTAIEKNDKQAKDMAKKTMGTKVYDGFEYDEKTFADLAVLLNCDAAFSPFKFKDGIRSKNNIISGAKWIVFDIDNTTLSAEDVHFMLGNYNHHIALTSDPNNKYKYRLLLELDAEVSVSPDIWRHFCTLVAKEVGVHIDKVPQSQIFYSYAGRDVYSNLEGEPVNTRDHLMEANQIASKTSTPQKSLTTPQKKVLLDDPLTTFHYAFNALNGEGSLSMYKMMSHAKDLGSDLDYALELIDDINDSWESPMEEERIIKLKEQCRSIFLKA